MLVLGTTNRKKAEELIRLLAPAGVELCTLADVGGGIEVVEDGATFAENAAKKAASQARHLGCWVLGEDSGLAVDALEGAPGVYSARFSGPEATDDSNNQLLLKQLAGVPAERRGAGYVCHMALADSAGTVWVECHGTCRGRILPELRGSAGFGYDPLFELLEYHHSFGQLGPVAKAVLSHRARAARLLLPKLMTLVDSSELR
ncbi:MAG: non-canonical purine NTP pyrophosphatase [Patescibacteria group bacterium]|nr:non-canonical purine NTP pyrophosphatase [Patescibacteria group bacterium]